MKRQQIRPTLGDLASYDELAFPELLNGEAPSAKVTRTKPPTIVSTSSIPSTSTSATPIQLTNPVEPIKIKPKSRFALQREREAAERLAAAAASRGSERFTLNLDEDNVEDMPILPQLVGEVIERETDLSIPLPPSLFSNTASPIAGRREDNGFPHSSKLQTVELDEENGEDEIKETSEVDLSTNELPSMLSSISKANDQVLAGLSEIEIREEQRQIRESMGLSESVIKMLEERGRKKVIAPVVKKVVMRTSTVPVVKPKVKSLEEEEEGTPEYIRRHFFPNEPTNSNLDWMRDPTASTSTLTDAINLPTFNLQGEPLATSSIESSHSASSSHHVSSSTSFTLPSLLSLTTSAVSSQRSTSLLVLEKILSKPSNQSLLGKKVWSTLRVDSGKNSSWAIRDTNLGVSTAAISLLDQLFTSELDSFLSPSSGSIDQLAPGAEEPLTLVAAFLSTDPYPIFTRLLSTSTLPDESYHSIVSILHSVLLLSSNGQPASLAVEELIASPHLLESISKRLISIPWPCESPSPSVLAIKFFTDIARSSRVRAKALIDRKLVDSGLRFFSTLLWNLEVEFKSLGYELSEAVLNYWTVIGRYGLSTSIRTKSSDVLRIYVDNFSSLLEQEEIKKEDTSLMIKMFELLEIWTTAAIDPHSTEHDIVWTQVEEWSHIALEAFRWTIKNTETDFKLLISALNLLAAWLEGSKVNKGWRGEKEREWINSNIGKDFILGGKVYSIVENALRRLSTTSSITMEVDSSLVSAALRLSRAYEEELDSPTPALLIIDSSLLPSVFNSLFSLTKPIRSITRVLIDLLPLSPSIPIQFSATIQVLSILTIDDAVTVKALLDWTFSTISDVTNLSHLSLHPTLELPVLSKINNLKPFFSFAINSIVGGKVVSPIHPISKDLIKSTCQYPFASPSALLNSNWPLITLNELLRSGTSPVFQNLPVDWDASESDLVKCSLVLMRITESIQGGNKTSATVLIYDLIKVFMLEKDNLTTGTPGSESDLFRDSSVEYSMSQLLLPITISNQPIQLLIPDSRTSNETIEKVSSLVSSAPFYRLYTDLVGLFDSISMSHPLFAQILLPPLAMSYPIDYRKLLWTDYSHVLSTIRMTINEAITDNVGNGALSSYLYPVEKEIGILVAYGEAIVSKKITEEKNQFLYFIALHHLSASIFGEQGSVDTIQVKKLVKAIVGQGGNELKEKLLSYEQVEKEGERLLTAPGCYVNVGTRRLEREAKLKSILEL